MKDTSKIAKCIYCGNKVYGYFKGYGVCKNEGFFTADGEAIFSKENADRIIKYRHKLNCRIKKQIYENNNSKKKKW